MSLDSGLSPTKITEVSPDTVTAIPNIELAPVLLSNSLEADEDAPGARANPPAPGLAGDHDGDGTSHHTPIAYIDGIPVTVSVQNVDGQQRIVCVPLNPSGASMSFMDQLTESNPDGPTQPALLAEELSLLQPGMELHLTDPLDPVQPQADPTSLGQHHPPPCPLLEVQHKPLQPQTHEPKKEKRKGGWPKGKKRKPKKELTAPKAPTTGYVIFVNEHKLQLREEHPDLPFTEITRMLGLQWAQLDSLHKQRYNHEAEKDKQRYITELMAYQNTEAYQTFLRKKAQSSAAGFNGHQGTDTDMEEDRLNPTSYGEESSDLFCGICNQCFSSLHNKKEHLLGKQHLQALTEEFEKDKCSLPNTSSLEREREKETVQETERQGGEEEEEEEEEDLARLLGLSSLDISVLQELLIRHMNMRNFELQHMEECVARERRRQEQLKAELEDLQERKVCLEAELEALRVSGERMDSHIQTLSMKQLLSPAERGNRPNATERSSTLFLADDHRHEQAPPISALHQ